ncbi:MAG: lipid-A-disaccharide synthase [Chitinophagales bacterium]|nr:lipid-A-disaccharide synthase [Chitinophagaceae bacterium]MCB9065273.1 lipid-A-disaccharide synthase [Chitinophagales bacterium]
MRYYVIAGEASGDLHGGNLIKALHKKDGQADVRCWGGDKMQAAGATLVKHYRDLAFMGFVEVIANLRTILRNIDLCKKDIIAYNPDVLILIDYPGFNLRIAEWAKQQGIKVVYYISPQVWAWKANRVKKIKRDVDKMLVILPFEVNYYRDKWNYDVSYVGHPLTEVVDNEIKNVPAEPVSDKPIIALLPGSRKQEIKVKLPIMLKMVERFLGYRFVVAQAPSQPESFYQEMIGDKDVLVVNNQTYNLLKQAKAALVTSGTATLETALFGVPEVVCYKGNAISFWLATKLVDVKYISLVNLIMDKEVIKELIQDDFNEDKLHEELKKVLEDESYITNMKADYKELWHKLGDYKTSELAADEVLTLLGQ